MSKHKAINYLGRAPIYLALLAVGWVISKGVGLYTPYMPHAVCWRYDPTLINALVLGNGMIFVAYMVIPLVIRKMLISVASMSELSKRTMKWFAAFILCCGFGHLFDLVEIYKTDWWFGINSYYFTAFWRVVTGTVSLVTLYHLSQSMKAVGDDFSLEGIRDQLTNVLEGFDSIAIERKKSKEREQFLYEFAESSPFGSLFVDMTGRIIHTTRSFAGYLNYEPDELKGKLFVEMLHKADVPITNFIFEELIAGRPPTQSLGRTYLLNRYRRKDGGYTWIYWYMEGTKYVNEHFRAGQGRLATEEEIEDWVVVRKRFDNQKLLEVYSKFGDETNTDITFDQIAEYADGQKHEIAKGISIIASKLGANLVNIKCWMKEGAVLPIHHHSDFLESFNLIEGLLLDEVAGAILRVGDSPKTFDLNEPHQWKTIEDAYMDIQCFKP